MPFRKCRFCKYESIYSGNVYRHQRNEHAGENIIKQGALKECKICGFIAKCARSLKRHHISMHEDVKYNASSPHTKTCSVCDKKCTTQNALINHLADQHENGPSYKQYLDNKQLVRIWITIINDKYGEEITNSKKDCSTQTQTEVEGQSTIYPGDMQEVHDISIENEEIQMEVQDIIEESNSLTKTTTQHSVEKPTNEVAAHPDGTLRPNIWI